VPLEIKLFAIATYLVSSSVRRTASVLGVGKSSVHYWITRFKESLDYKPENVKSLGIVRLGVDETILKYNGRKCYLFAAIDLERNKIIHLRVYSARNSMTSHAFLKRVLSMCEVEEIVLDRGPWYRDALCRLGVKVRYESFGDRSLVESVFSSFKQRAKIFFCSITVNFKRKDKKLGSLRWTRAIECWNNFCKMFIFYYNFARG
jgi:Transposase and inactivated derivatives